MANDCPVVPVHGLFGWGPDEMAAFPYWGTGLSVPSPLPRHQASVGPVSSLHDRACELAFEIKGGRYDFDLDHWGLHPRPGERLDTYVGRIAASPLFAGPDNGLTSLTVQSLAEQNARCTTHADTWYFSHVTEQTVTGQLSGYAYPEPGMNPFLVPAGLYTGRKRFARPLHEGFVSSEWWPNDGMVSVHSQAHPRSAGDHPVAGDLDATADPEPGGWYVQMLPGIDHVAIVALPRLDQIGRQKRFYRALYQRLHDLDVRR